MNALLLLVALTSTLVLRSGDRIVAEGPVREENGILIFRSAGTLYTLPAEEVDRIETGSERAPAAETAKPQEPKASTLRLRVTEEERKRLLAELEKNHSGTPAPPQQILQAPPLPTRAEVAQQKQDEKQWRREARQHREAIQRAREELALLEARVEELRWKIQSLVSLGYKPSQFTYDTTQLARTQEQIPYAQLEVTRAERAWEQFRDDARRDEVPPGWLR